MAVRIWNQKWQSAIHNRRASKNISKPISAFVCHRELFLSSQETRVDFWFQVWHDVQHEGCDVNGKSGHACGFWYQGRPERRLTWNETGKESHFTFGIGSLLIAFYCILMMMMMMIYKGIRVSVHKYQTKIHQDYMNKPKCDARESYLKCKIMIPLC